MVKVKASKPAGRGETSIVVIQATHSCGGGFKWTGDSVVLSGTTQYGHLCTKCRRFELLERIYPRTAKSAIVE